MPNATVNGITIDYSPAGDGPPVLLICGTGQPADLWFAPEPPCPTSPTSSTPLSSSVRPNDPRQPELSNQVTPAATRSRQIGPAHTHPDPVIRGGQKMFLDCPAWLDQDGAVRCGLPAEVRRRFITRSTRGALESAMIRCPAGHWFNGPIEFLTWESSDKHPQSSAEAAASATRSA
jgi:hypothetical protein